MTTARSLLLGCGNNHSKQIHYNGSPNWAGELTKVDMDPNCGADIILNMDDACHNLPFDDSTFDDCGIFNSLEHWGRQGDWKGWFDEMGELHRILKPGGLVYILVPIGPDALADPGHTRFFQQNWFGFLSQVFYERNETLQSCFTDYRWYWKKNFDILYMEEHGTPKHHLAVVMKKA